MYHVIEGEKDGPLYGNIHALVLNLNGPIFGVATVAWVSHNPDDPRARGGAWWLEDGATRIGNPYREGAMARARILAKRINRQESERARLANPGPAPVAHPQAYSGGY